MEEDQKYLISSILEEDCKSPEDFLKQNSRLKSKTDNIDSINSAFVYIGLFGTIISLIIVCTTCRHPLLITCTCLRAFKKSQEAEPKESLSNSVAVNQVDDSSSEQLHHPTPSLEPGQDQMDIVTPPETLGRPTPFSVNQRWSGQAALSHEQYGAFIDKDFPQISRV